MCNSGYSGVNRPFLAAVLSAALFFVVSASGAPVGFETAENAARAHLERKRGGGKIRRGLAHKTGSFTPYFVFEKENRGFVIVSADDAAAPVLGETDGGVFDKDSMPPALVWLLGTYEGQIEEAAKNGGARDDETKALWKQAARSTGAAAEASYPLTLLSTKWKQGAPYNSKTPIDGGARSAAGCVATAMAQIMKYWRHPAYGTGLGGSYYTTTKHIYVPPVNFRASYGYDDMLDDYPDTNSGTAAQREAVSTLTYHAGVSVDMDYTKVESAAYSRDAALALVRNFGYDNSVRYIWSPYSVGISASEWKDIVLGQMENNSPVYYSGYDDVKGGDNGHAFVIDGYDKNTDKFHINWGWGGNYDGFFALTALNPDKYRFSVRQGMIINIMPNKNGNPPSQIKASEFNVSTTRTALNAGVMAKVNYGAGFFGKIGFAVMSGGAVGTVLDSADCSINNMYGISGMYAVYYENAKLSRQFTPGMPSGELALRVVTKRGGGEWTPAAGETRHIYVPPIHAVTFDANGGAVSVESGITNISSTLESLPAPTRAGYTFNGWFTRKAGGTAVTTNTVFNADAVVYAQWTPVADDVPAATAVLAPDRVIPPVNQSEETAAATPATALTAEFTAGPNPAVKSSGVVTFFRNGSRIKSAALYVYDASGSAVRKISINDNINDNINDIINNDSRRAVGSWDLKDAKGRPVSKGTYLVGGVINTAGGKSEKASLIVGVR